MLNARVGLQARGLRIGFTLLLGGWCIGQSVAARPAEQPVDVAQATLLSALGERPSFSPDGRRIAFIGKAYGDAYELELVTGKVRNLSRDVPHQGILRVQYLANGDYLITAPRHYDGPDSRARVEMWVLGKSLEAPLQPLGEKPLEGIAISRRSNLIAWTAFAPGTALGPKEGWSTMFFKPTKGAVKPMWQRWSGIARMRGCRENRGPSRPARFVASIPRRR